MIHCPQDSLSAKLSCIRTYILLYEIEWTQLSNCTFADIYREQALQSMKRKPTPERPDDTEPAIRNTISRDTSSRDTSSRDTISRDSAPGTAERFRTRAESPVLGKLVYETFSHFYTGVKGFVCYGVLQLMVIVFDLIKQSPTSSNTRAQIVGRQWPCNCTIYV